MAAPLIIVKHNGKELEVKKCVTLHTMSVGLRQANCRLTRERRAAASPPHAAPAHLTVHALATNTHFPNVSSV